MKMLETFVEIIRKTSTDLPDDVVAAIHEGRGREAGGSRGEYAMCIIQKNIALAETKSQPLCQDTGSILFYIHYPRKVDADALAKTIRKAVTLATKKGYLRQNSV